MYEDEENIPNELDIELVDVASDSVMKDPELVSYIKKEFKEKTMYIDDLDLTRILIQEIQNRQSLIEQGLKPVGPSNALGVWFVKVVDRMLTRGNFRGYSDNYKDEFKSNAYLFFARYWWKFDATRVIGNYSVKDGVKTLKEPETFKGGFSYFTTLAWTATMGALKTLKENDISRQKIAEDKFKNSGDDIATEYYVGRQYNVGY